MSRAVDADRIGWRTYLTMAAVVGAVLAGMLVVSANTPPPHPTAAPKHGTHPAPTTPIELTLGVWGTKPELAAYRSIAATYQRRTPGVRVKVQVYPSAGAMAKAVQSDAQLPNVFLLRDRDLSGAMAHRRNKPLHDLVTDRGINPGDDYSRNAVAAFSADDDLQCMPYTASPLVMYYNTDLIDLARVKAPGLTPASVATGSFTFDQFRAAVRYAVRAHHGRIAGVAVPPTLEGLAPFVLSGGGKLFDDQSNPKTLTLSSDTGALRRTLQVLRDPGLTLSSAQLRKKSPLQWFEAGRVGMIEGSRDLVPVLRSVHGLHFDVLPFPNLGAGNTTGDIRGLCLASGRPSKLSASADLLTYLVGDQAMTRLARVGSLQPADLRAAYSKAFQQPGRQPEHGQLFTTLLRDIAPEPLTVPWKRLDTAVEPKLRQLFDAVYLDDLDQRLNAIDQRSRPVLAPPKPTPTNH